MATFFGVTTGILTGLIAGFALNGVLIAADKSYRDFIRNECDSCDKKTDE